MKVKDLEQAAKKVSTNAQAQQNWQSGFQPYAAVIAGIIKPPRGVRGSLGNYAIVQTIGDKLHKEKAQRKAQGTRLQPKT